MKSFYFTRYRFYKPKQTEHTIFAISDMHFSNLEDHEVFLEKIERIATFAAKQQPKLITISGDVVDNLESVDTTADRACLKAGLEHLAQIAPVCICLGNHDFYRKPEGADSYLAEKNQTLIDEINELENVHLLDNAVYEDDEFYVFGLTLPPEYYNFSRESNEQGSVGNPAQEKLGVLIDQLDLIPTEKLPRRKTKILLVHSPVHLTNEAVQPTLANYDFVFAGHMHNGVVPPLVNEIWRSHKGFLTPDKHVFTDQNTRIGLYGDNLIVLGAITTVQSGIGRVAFIKKLFPLYVATISTSHNENYARKPDIYKKYLK